MRDAESSQEAGASETVVGKVWPVYGRWLNSVMVGVLRGEVGRDVGARERGRRREPVMLGTRGMGAELAEALWSAYPRAP